MLSDSNLGSKRALAAALAALSAGAMLATGASALAQVAGSEKGTTGVLSGTKEAGPVAAVRSLVEQGRLIEARAAMDAIVNSGQIDRLSESQKSAAFTLLKSIDGKIQTADPAEMSLQKSELGLAEGDLLSAERQAKAVASRSQSTPAQRERAEKLLTDVAQRQSELRPMVPGLISQATTDFDAQNYGAAKSNILAVLRSGVELSPEQASKLDRYQLDIVELERLNGKVFGVDPALALLQPGKVRRPEPLPEVAPGAAPAAEQPIAQNTEPAMTPPPPPPAPAAPADPVPAMAPVAPAPAPIAAADDVVTQAMRIEAQRIVAEADQAFAQARYTSAQDKYTLALAQFRNYLSAEDVSRIESRIAECRVRVDSNVGGSDLASQVIKGEQLVRQRAEAEFNSLMGQADTRLSEGSTDKAQDLLAQARLAISRARGSFNEAEFAGYEKRLDEMRVKIEAKRTEIEATDAKTKQETLAKTAAAAETNRLAEKQRKVTEAIERVRALQADRKYEEALQVVDQTLFLDPNNPTALLLRDILRDMIIFTRYHDAQSEKQFRHAQMAIDNFESTLPPKGPMDFPSDWPAKTFQRGETSAFADSPENRKVLAQMTSPSTKIPVDLNENRFEDVLKFIQSVTQLSIDPDWESLATIGVEKDTPVTLKLSPVTYATALDRVLAKVSRDQFAKAGWAVNEGIVTVASDETLRKNRTLVIYDIKDLLFVVRNYTDVPQIDLNSVLQQSQGGSGQSPFQNDQAQQNQDDPAARERRIRQIIDIIQANVDFEGWKDNGGETGSLQELNGSLIITNTPKNHREIVGLLSKLREIRNMQINVETKFLLVNQNWFEQIGFDLDIVFNTGSNQVTAAQQTNSNTIPSDFFNFSPANNGKVGLQRTLTGIPVPPGTTQPSTFGTVPANNQSPIGVGQNSLGQAVGLVEGDFATGILAAAPALGIAGQFLDDIQVDFLVVATQADKRTVRLTAPRLTFTNGQTANIYVVTQQAFVSGLTPIVGDSAVGFNPTVSVLSEGVTMLVEGVISADRRWVTMSIDAGVARLDGFQQSSVSAVAGGQLVNSADTQSFIQLPQITVTRVRTTVTVPDEGTVLLGGQRLITELEIETGVPVLSKIPIINRFFSNRIESKEEQTLLIMLKPTILIQAEEEEKAFPGLLDSVRTGLGVR